MYRILVALVAFAFALPVQAAWHRAESDHFVIYADDSEKDLARFAEALEKYHAAMSLVTGREVEKPSPSNRVTIYAVGGSRSMRKLAETKNVGGFYMPRAGGSVAFVPDVRPSYGEPRHSFRVLLHEYAHHFLIGSARFGMPRWMDEGGAEFFASARFMRDGEVHLGRAANHRAGELAFATKVSMEELFERGNVQRGGTVERDSFYGRSWALYHYLTFSEERKGQLLDYARRIAAGQSSLDAARSVFGDIDALGHEVDEYLKQRKMNAFVIAPDRLTINPVIVRPVSAGMAEMMPVIMRSKRGVKREQANEVLIDAREVAAAYPQDADVLAALAEAEYDAGNLTEAIAAADAALAIDPASKNALVQKGYALFAQARDAEDADAAYAQAMKPFSALNRLEQDHPLPLIYYYQSFVRRGAAPNETARHALERASRLSPFDRSLAMNAGLMQAREGKIALARRTLQPVAANPHGGRMADDAQRYLDELAEVEEGTEWRPRRTVDLGAVLKSLAKEREDDADESAE
ncbi:DUF1570 domain-containing protein [Qipengyuania flava]|uniref:DUF1570 domain-containing protein n=1 Tax=Qipengyuania flava TaxID=192812 RepID=UPI001C639063|nr:DUF1570 domain-containing protein [Qipengyuania flava]QYJ08110.1 DUF1570 domain-containing protein [Qipengyuania flava]